MEFMICDFRFTIWQAAVLLPEARWVLETLLRKLVRDLKDLVRLPGIPLWLPPWRGGINRENSKGRE
jgi:hypothetical protein